jgi:hypothetical protein
MTADHRSAIAQRLKWYGRERRDCTAANFVHLPIAEQE